MQNNAGPNCVCVKTAFSYFADIGLDNETRHWDDINDQSLIHYTHVCHDKNYTTEKKPTIMDEKTQRVEKKEKIAIFEIILKLLKFE